MVSTRKKRQSNRRLISQLDDFDPDMIIGNAVSERQENTVVNEGTNDRDFTISNSDNSSVVNGNAMSVKTLERCSNERIDREMSSFVETVEDRIHNAILTAIDNNGALKKILAIRSINATSGRDVTSVSSNSERREHVGIIISCENASGNKNLLGVSNVNDETRHNIPDEVSELSVPETHFEPQAQTHHLVTGQTAQTNQIPDVLTGHISTPRNPPSHPYQNLSTQVSQDNSLPMVEQTPRNQNLDANNSFKCLVDAIARIATQQRPQAATMLKPVSTNTLIFDGKTRKSNSLKTYFTQRSKFKQRWQKP